MTDLRFTPGRTGRWLVTGALMISALAFARPAAVIAQTPFLPRLIRRALRRNRHF